MHRTQIYIEDDIFTKMKNVSKSLDISVSEFIRQAINNKLKSDSKDDMEQFFDNFKPLESFKDIEPTEYVKNIRSKSRIIND